MKLLLKFALGILKIFDLANLFTFFESSIASSMCWAWSGPTKTLSGPKEINPCLESNITYILEYPQLEV
jgi:hypothetical protein